MVGTPVNFFLHLTAPSDTFTEVLGITRNASKADIKKAYHKVRHIDVACHRNICTSLPIGPRLHSQAILIRLRNMSAKTRRSDSRLSAKRTRYYTMSRNGIFTTCMACRPSLVVAAQAEWARR